MYVFRTSVGDSAGLMFVVSVAFRSASCHLGGSLIRIHCKSARLTASYFTEGATHGSHRRDLPTPRNSRDPKLIMIRTQSGPVNDLVLIKLQQKVTIRIRTLACSWMSQSIQRQLQLTLAPSPASKLATRGKP